ncbi:MULTISPECIES: type II toxin-antitoxin system RelE/ParE family toxin [Methylobacterium]|uniref:type II toxin-antitoxin system RelE/ParE family toxin n=1 Tax=Methylobacterium TaxID=407 RepID=UPI0013EC44EB|nr:type II toxin-antitoxin system RelE/ParE family toxin [Methylobacterium sp. DB0501]NGM34702.1 type II toxin-antitoxin system RelE/ParE family toxin [Methylobacterium sp. DB0501]
MVEIRRTATYATWIDGLHDRRAAARIEARSNRMRLGNPGVVKPVGESVSEMRIDDGPGYRVYFVQRGTTLVILPCGGSKSSQERDIRTAKSLVKEV